MDGPEPNRCGGQGKAEDIVRIGSEVFLIKTFGEVIRFERAIKMKRPVQAVFILALVITMAIAGCEEQIAVENRQIKEKPEHAIGHGKKPHHKKLVKRNALIENGVFIQIPGPNPIITPGPDGAWDDGVTEAADAFKDVDTYYFYYHATGAGKGYRLGVASSTHP